MEINNYRVRYISQGQEVDNKLTGNFLKPIYNFPTKFQSIFVDFFFQTLAHLYLLF